MEVGLRVVRGPDWMWQDQDGGEGHVGTVVEDGTGHNNIPSQTVVVQWDSGFRANYRIGLHGAYDLRVFDSGPVGVKHVKEVCNVCKKKDIPGGRWKCLQCNNNFNMCQHCYMSDQHDIHHSFLRFDSFNSVEVPMRNTSRKIESSGIFPGATVVRGPHWKWGDQDGGEGMQGTVQDCDGESSTGVKVSWTSGQTNVYRLGHLGKVDLKCVREASGGSYYPDHLLILGQAAESGDHVKVCIDIDTLKDMQEGHGGWSPLMSKEPELAATTTSGWDSETEASVVGSSTVSNPRQLPGNTAACGQTVAERLAAVGPTVVSDPVTTSPRTQEPVATMSTSAEAEVSRTTDVDMTDVQPPVAEITTTPSRNRCKWSKTSIQWRNQLTTLSNMPPEKLVQGLDKIVLCTDKDFELGTGSFGTVVYVGLLDDGREIAVKRVLQLGPQWKESMQDEVNIVVKLRPHDNIVSYVLTECPCGPYGYIITELCEFSLNLWLQSTQVTNMSDEEWDRQVPVLMTDMLSGLNHLHTNNPVILHRDIKPQNFLVMVHDKKACLKLADFGISRTVDDGETALFTVIQGTRKWQAKEVIESGEGKFQYRKSTDIQVCGMVGYYIKSRGEHPFHAEKPRDVETRILNNNPDKNALNEPLVEDLIISMLQPEPIDRPSAADLLRHPYIWDNRKRWMFLVTFGESPEVENCHALPVQQLAYEIDSKGTEVFPESNDWSDLCNKMKLHLDRNVKSDNAFLTDFGRNGYQQSLCKVLRTIRNTKHHYATLSVGAQRMLGDTCYPISFFNTELPLLFITMYKLFRTSAGKPYDLTIREDMHEFA